MGLLTMVVRWFGATREAGGLAEPSGRRTAGFLIESFAGLLESYEAAWVIVVVGTTQWEPIWPRPPPVNGGSSVAELRVHRGCVDLSPFAAAPRAAHHDVKIAKMQKAFDQLLFVNLEAVRLQDLLPALLMQDRLKSLLAQIIDGMAKHIETTMGQLVAKKRTATPAFSFSYEFSVATDKGSICGLSMQLMVVGTSTNLAALCCPAVVVGRGRRVRARGGEGGGLSSRGGCQFSEAVRSDGGGVQTCLPYGTDF